MILIIKPSKNTFIVDRAIFGNTFTELKGDQLRVYLLMCRVVGVNPYGTFFMSLDTTAKEVNLSIHHTRNAIDWLCKNFFIKKVGKRKQTNMYSVLVVPDYHKESKRYFSNEHIQRNRYQLKNLLNGYCEIPIEVFQGSLLRDKSKWTDRKIKILGQLYLYHWIDEFGGVDPKAIHFNRNSMNISDLMSYTIGCSSSQVKQVIEWLTLEGYASRVKTVFRVNQSSCQRELQYVGDASRIVQQPNDVIIDVVRLTYIPDLKINDAKQRTGGNIAI